MRPLIQALVCVLFLIGVPLGIVQAQDNPPVQELYGSLSPGQTDVFLIKNLDKGQNLDIFAENVSGNLDPVVFILAGDTDIPTTLDNYRKAVADLAARSAYPLLELPALRDQYTLAWDDDSGPGASAVLQFNVSEAGDYYMFVSSSLSAAGRSTAGDYRLLVGLDAPQVLDGTAEPTGAVIAVQDQAALATHLIQEYTASLGEDKPQVTIKLSDLNPGETLYVDLRATSGGLKPRLVLRDYSNKPIQVSNLTGQAAEASLLQAFPEGGANYTLDVLATLPDGQVTSGDFRLVVGVNAPEVLDGLGEPNSESLLRLTIPVMVGLKLQQIVNIDQPNEIMNNVGTLKLEWTDPELAYNPDDCN